MSDIHNAEDIWDDVRQTVKALAVSKTKYVRPIIYCPSRYEELLLLGNSTPAITHPMYQNSIP